MKICFFFLFVILTPVAGFSQSIEPLIQSEYLPKTEPIEGHPFLFEEYNQTDLKTTSGSVDNVLTRYNLSDNNLIANIAGKEYILKKELIEAFILHEKKNGKSYNFVAQQIGAKKYFVESLYQDESGTRFLEWYKKQFTKGKPQPGYGVHDNSPDKYEDVTRYLFVINGQIIEYTKKKNDLLSTLSQNNPELKNLLADTMKRKKLKANDEDDIVTLLDVRAKFLSKNL